MNFIQRGLNQIFGGTFNSLFTRLYQIGTQGEVYIDIDQPLKIYEEIPEAQIVINKFADMFSNFEIKIKDNDGNLIEDEELINLLKNPNPYSKQNQFYRYLCVQYKIFGNTFLYKNKPSALLNLPVSLHALPTMNVKPDLTGKYINQTTIEDMVRKFVFEEMGKRTDLTVDEVLWLKNPSLTNPLIGQSKLVPLKYPLSNIQGAYKYRNAILTNKGPLGFFFSRNKITSDTFASKNIGFSKEDKETIENSFFKKYGTGDKQKAFAVLDGDAGFTPTSYPIKDMLLFEEVTENKLTICDMFGVSRNVFQTNTTFENLKNGLIQTYQDAIFPFADMVSQELTEFLKLENKRIHFDYSHIEILKENNLRGMQAVERGLNAINNAKINGLIDEQQAQSASQSLLESLGI